VTRGVVLLLALGACNLVFGLEPPNPTAPPSDADEIDSVIVAGDAAEDAVSFPDAPLDAPPLPIDAAIDAPPPPIDAPGCITCTAVSDNNECTYDVCCNGVTTHPPVPRDTLCNGWMDQCDGQGQCVDCTNSGGCGECCTCNQQQMCYPV
jgi:hypothetical protein